MIKEGFNPPEYLRRGLRLAAGMGLMAFIGFVVLTPESHVFAAQLSLVCKWGAITCVVVTVPLLGRAAQVSAEHTIGTFAGGFLAFSTYMAGLWVSQGNETIMALILSVLSAAVGFSSAWLGHLLGLDTSARLFAITFLIVVFGSDTSHAPLALALTRISGICCGVVLSLVLSVVILPRSASQEAVRCLQSSLKGLKTLTHLVWTTAPDVAEAAAARAAAAATAAAAAATAAKQAQAPRACSKRQDGYEPLLADEAPPVAGPLPVTAAAAAEIGSTASLSFAAWEAEEKHKAACEKALMKVYSDLTKMEEHLPLADREIPIGFPWTARTFFLPGVKLLGCGGGYVPHEDMAEAANSMRRVARLLWAVHVALEEGFDDNVRAALTKQYPEGVMPQLAQFSEQIIEDMVQAVPRGSTISFDAMYDFNGMVEKLRENSDSRRQRVQQFLQAVKTRRPRPTSTFRRRVPRPPRPPGAPPAAGADPNSNGLHEPHSPGYQQNDPLADLWGSPPRNDDPTPSPIPPGDDNDAPPATPTPDDRPVTESPRGMYRPPTFLHLPHAADGTTTSPPPTSPSTDTVPSPFLPGPRGFHLPHPTTSETSSDLSSALLASPLMSPPSQATDWGGSSQASVTMVPRLALPSATTPPARAPNPPDPSAPWSSSPRSSSASPPALTFRDLPDPPAAPLWPNGPSDFGNAGPPRVLIPGQQNIHLLMRSTAVRDGPPTPAFSDATTNYWANLQSNLSTYTQATSTLLDPAGESVLHRSMSVMSDPLLFPDTIEGYISQVRWYSFQFLMDELADELLDLHTAIAHIEL